MKALTSTLAALTLAAIFGGFGAIGGATEAVAGTNKPMLKVEGKSYYSKQKAKRSAIGRWEIKAAAKHSSLFKKWEDASKKNFDCKRKTHQGNARKLWTCIAKAKPGSKVKFCKSGKVNAKWIHPNEAGAKAGARNDWEKRAAAKHGMKYSFYKNAISKQSTCGTDSKYPGKIVCTLAANACK